MLGLFLFFELINSWSAVSCLSFRRVRSVCRWHCALIGCAFSRLDLLQHAVSNSGGWKKLSVNWSKTTSVVTSRRRMATLVIRLQDKLIRVAISQWYLGVNRPADLNGHRITTPIKFLHAQGTCSGFKKNLYPFSLWNPQSLFTSCVHARWQIYEGV